MPRLIVETNSPKTNVTMRFTMCSTYFDQCSVMIIVGIACMIFFERRNSFSFIKLLYSTLVMKK